MEDYKLMFMVSLLPLGW